MKSRAARWGVRALLAVTGLAVAAFLVIASGIVSVKASSGHFAFTRWLLHFAMHRSVSTYSLAVDMQRLEEPWLVLKGAGHYESGCRPCHGAPDLEVPVIPHGMTPHPPQLSGIIANWDEDELFYLVKHGLKFTGMPAWPSQQRDDEVRAVVAFLRELPRLDGAAYRELVHGPAEHLETAAPLGMLLGLGGAPSLALASCARCHGVSGQGRGSAAFPKLRGQKPEYQMAALRAFARGARHSGIMQPIAAGLRPEQMRRLAEYYSSATEETGLGTDSPSSDRAASDAVERGREIALHGIPAQGVPSCADCHGPADFDRNPFYPKLAGQFPDYLVLQLELFKEGRRGGSAYAHLMRQVASRLESEQMRQVASYYGSLREEPLRRKP